MKIITVELTEEQYQRVKKLPLHKYHIILCSTNGKNYLRGGKKAMEFYTGITIPKIQE